MLRESRWREEHKTQRRYFWDTFPHPRCQTSRLNPHTNYSVFDRVLGAIMLVWYDVKRRMGQLICPLSIKKNSKMTLPQQGNSMAWPVQEDYFRTTFRPPPMSNVAFKSTREKHPGWHGKAAFGLFAPKKHPGMALPQQGNSMAWPVRACCCCRLKNTLLRARSPLQAGVGRYSQERELNNKKQQRHKQAP